MTMKWKVYLLSLAGLTLAFPAVAQEKAARVIPAALAFPGGASSVTEAHQDWTVTCAIRDNRKECFFSQVLGRSQGRERVLTIELGAPKDGQVKGTLFAPFGLRLDAGVNLHLDEKEFAGNLPFYMCVEQGCIVPLTFEPNAVKGLSGGTSVQFSAVNGATQEPLKIAISLAGFTSAMNRSTELER